MNTAQRLVIEETLREYLTPERFENWLRSQPEDMVVGKTGQGWNCPIARYLKDKGLHNISVGNLRMYVTSDWLTPFTPPPWCHDFIDGVDIRSHQPPNSPVTAANALKVLANAGLPSPAITVEAAYASGVAKSDAEFVVA